MIMILFVWAGVAQ